MLTCPVCGFRNSDQNQRCFRCQAMLKEDMQEFSKINSLHRRRYKDDLSLFVQGLMAKIALRNPLRRYWEIPQNISYRYPWTAGGLSLIPGLGQVYNHQYVKSMIVSVGWFLFLALCIVTIQMSFSNILLILLLCFYLMIWNDSVATAIRINGETWSWRNTIALWFGLLCICGVTFSIAQIMGMKLVSFVRITGLEQGPFRRGDIIMVNHMAYWFEKPRIGEVIYFDPPAFKADRPPNEYFINTKDYFQVIVAQGGDVIKKNGDTFFRNGQAIPPHESPIGGGIIPDWEFRVPPNHYFAPVTKIARDAPANMLGANPPPLFSPGWNFPKWADSTMITPEMIYGEAVAVVNPPTHRRWF